MHQSERVDIPNSEVNTDDPDGKDENERIEVTHENDEQVAVQARRYPLRERKPPKYSAEFNTDLKKNSGLHGHVEVLNFFFQASLRNCINCVHCDDHFFIFFSFPQFIYDLFHISLTLVLQHCSKMS